MAFKLNLKPIKQCDRRKVRYHSEAEARWVLLTMKHYDKHRPQDGRLQIYLCDDCGAYHLGHTKNTNSN